MDLEEGEYEERKACSERVVGGETHQALLRLVVYGWSERG